MSASVRRLFAVAAAVAVAASASSPAMGAAKHKPPRAGKGAVCAVKSGSLRPSPVRVCRKAVKAPRALPR